MSAEIRSTIFILCLAATWMPAQEHGPRGPGGSMRMSPILRALDQDHDGVVTSAELDNAATVLQGLDKNGDGKLAADELRPQFGPDGRGRGPGGNPEEMVKTLMAFDKDGDGKLSKTEVPERMQGIFARADSDNDGFLTAEEISKLPAARPAPDGRMGRGEGRPADPTFLALDTDKDGSISAAEMAAAPASLRSLDKNGDGKLTEDEVRPNFGPGNAEERVKQMMESRDQNGDGKLSKSELPPQMQEWFSRMDTDGDGFVTAAELLKALPAQGRFRGGDRRPERQ